MNNYTSRMLFFWRHLLLVLLAADATAQTVPPLINYQGKLVSSNGLPLSTGDYQLRFRIYDAVAGGNLIWGPQVFNGQNGHGFGPVVPVVQGWFNVILGPFDTNAFPISSAFMGTNRFVEIQLGTNAPFSPRQQILSAPYALRANSAGLADVATTAVQATALTGGVTSNQLVNGSVTFEKLALRSVGTNVDIGGIALSLTEVDSTFPPSDSLRTVTNLVITLKTTGRPVMVSLVQGEVVGSSELSNSSSPHVWLTMYVYLFRDGDQIGSQESGTLLPSLGIDPERVVRVPTSAFRFLDIPAAGIHTYTIKLGDGGTGETLRLRNCRLIAYEL